MGNNRFRKYILQFGVLIIPVLMVFLFINQFGSDKQQRAAQELAFPSVFPLFSGKPFALPDTLQYFYNTIDSRGIALSGGEFSVYIKYPVFRSEDDNASKLVSWLQEQIFILAHEGAQDNTSLRKLFNNNYTAYANYVLNSWLSTEETTYTGCMQERLSVEVVLNSQIITMKVHHKGYWGGAHGDDIVSYAMFDKEFNAISPKSIICHEKLAAFHKLLLTEYELNIEPWRDYDIAYKSNPEYLALVPEGLIVTYSGYAYAEGQPAMLIKPVKFINLLKPEFRLIYINRV